MTFSSQDRRLVLAGGLCVAFGGLLLGCDAPSEIRVQDVPKQVIEPEEFAGLEEQPHTILAAMVPHGDEAWVFRLDGPTEEVQSQRDAFESFIASLSFGERGSRPDWDLPAGWEESSVPPGSLREATIQVPIEGGTGLGLSVSRLPAREDWLHYRLRNFNRWRRQLQLPVAGADVMADLSQTIPLDDSNGKTVSVVAISGRFSESELAPMARGHGLPTRSAPPPAVADSPEPGLTYDAPGTWSAGPTSAMRRASFVVTDGERQATIVVTAFPARSGSQMADPLANINRWRGQVGLPALAAGEVAANTEAVQVDDLEGLYVALDGAGAGAGRAMRAVMVEHGDHAWFFKLDGPQDLVERETERFRKFLQTVEFVE